MKTQVMTEAFHSGQRAAQNSGVSRVEALEDTEDRNADIETSLKKLQIVQSDYNINYAI